MYIASAGQDRSQGKLDFVCTQQDHGTNGGDPKDDQKQAAMPTSPQKKPQTVSFSPSEDNFYGDPKDNCKQTAMPKRKVSISSEVSKEVTHSENLGWRFKYAHGPENCWYPDSKIKIDPDWKPHDTAEAMEMKGKKKHQEEKSYDALDLYDPKQVLGAHQELGVCV